MNNLLHRLRSRFDEAYRIEHGFGLSPVRSNRELRALVKFCKHELNEPSMGFNPYKKRLFEATIDLANVDERLVELPLEFKHHDHSYRMYIHVREIINDNTGWYWS